jgi:hypothetical protein
MRADDATGDGNLPACMLRHLNTPACVHWVATLQSVYSTRTQKAQHSTLNTAGPAQRAQHSRPSAALLAPIVSDALRCWQASLPDLHALTPQHSCDLPAYQPAALRSAPVMPPFGDYIQQGPCATTQSHSQLCHSRSHTHSHTHSHIHSHSHSHGHNHSFRHSRSHSRIRSHSRSHSHSPSRQSQPQP